MRRKKLYILSLVTLFCLTSVSNGFSQEIPDRPDPPRLVNDFAGVLTTDDVNILERQLVAFNDSTSTQIAIVIVPTLSGYDKADYAQRLGEKWGIGQKGLNNGVLILVKPKTPDSNGEVQIAPGYGLEGVIPDITCAEIVDYDILPAFKAGDYFTGLNEATKTIMALTRGEFSAADYGNVVKKSKKDGMGIVSIIFIIVIIIFIFSSGSGRSNKNISTKGLPIWLLLSMMSSGKSSGSGSWGGFSGGGGGGFGGFGGGSFGGGGAGGSW